MGAIGPEKETAGDDGQSTLNAIGGFCRSWVWTFIVI
jgi:hypothetical protein